MGASRPGYILVIGWRNPKRDDVRFLDIAVTGIYERSTSNEVVMTGNRAVNIWLPFSLEYYSTVVFVIRG